MMLPASITWIGCDGRKGLYALGVQGKMGGGLPIPVGGAIFVGVVSRQLQARFFIGQRPRLQFGLLQVGF